MVEEQPMDPEQLALLAAVAESPDDDVVRLVYADWLEEQGEADAANFIRAQVHLARIVVEDEELGGLAAEQVRPSAREALLAPLLAAGLVECVNRFNNGPEIGAKDVVPGTLNVSFPGCRGDLLMLALDLAGVACSTGSACSSGSLLPSPVLRAMGVPEEVLRSALRFSFSPSTTAEELELAAAQVSSAVKSARDSARLRV